MSQLIPTHLDAQAHGVGSFHLRMVPGGNQLYCLACEASVFIPTKGPGKKYYAVPCLPTCFRLARVEGRQAVNVG